MKKSLVAIAVLSAFSGAAFAQAAPASSVTLFGIIDTSVRYTNNGDDRRVDVATDGLASSRLGFRGVEDLGGGMRAGFWIEGATGADVGTSGGQTWQRRQTVSLLGGFGEVRLGRDYAPTFWNATVFDPFGTNGVGAFSNIHAPHVGIGQFVRNNNTVGYFLPSNLGGLYGQVMVAAMENAGSNNNKYVGGRIGWQGGPVNVAAAYGQNYVAPTAGFQNDETAAIANIGAAYTIGPATIMGTYGRFTLGDNVRTNALIGATVKLGPGSLRAAYSRFTNDDAPVNGANQIAVGYIYDMSRRTAVYGTVSRVSNDGTATTGANFGANSGGSAGGGIAPTRGKNYTGAEIGVRHSF